MSDSLQPHGLSPTRVLHNCCYCSVTQLCLTLCNPWTAAHQASLSCTISRSLCKLMSIGSVMPSKHLMLCCPLLLLSLVLPSIRVFSLSQLFSSGGWSIGASTFQHQSFQWIDPGLSSCRIDWFDLLAVQATLKSLLQHHSLKASILWHLAFFMVQLSHLYMTTGKTIAWHLLFVSNHQTVSSTMTGNMSVLFMDVFHVPRIVSCT